jgi:hypothetical protein
MGRSYEMSEKQRWTLINACGIAAQQAVIGAQTVAEDMANNAYCKLMVDELKKAATSYSDMGQELQKFDKIMLVDEGDDD